MPGTTFAPIVKKGCIGFWEMHPLLLKMHPLNRKRGARCDCIECNAKGKTIRVISTHEGSGLASMVTDVKRMCKGADVKPGLAIVGLQAKNSKQKVAEWL